MFGGTVPSFMRGVFDWEARGYHFAESPPAELQSPKLRGSGDPWMVLAACLQEAQLGRFGSLDQLRPLIREDASARLVRGCVELLGDVGTIQSLSVLLNVVAQGQDALVVEACWGCHLAGLPRLVPAMVDAWLKLKRQADRDSVGTMFSQMLEEAPGPLSVNEEYEPSAYAKLVLARSGELVDKLGSDRAPVWEGRLFSLTELTTRKRQLLADGEETPYGLAVEFTDFRHRFEATTGIDCSSFFYEEEFRPLGAAALLEEFLEGPGPPKYEAGVRYFFDHRISN